MSDPITRLNVALEGRYRIGRKLGEGGMATVFLADDLRHERKVALKVLKPELAAVIGAERFVSEIKTTASLQHPHILPLFDSGEIDGSLFYVMPYVEGETLRDRINREKQLGVDDALDYAHRHGVIHRDIKPENILLHDGRPVVADFGIAVAISAAGGGRLTETGMSLGTPHYMSPEQATADRDLTVRSDVYSLACVLYEMLTGDPPHTGPTAQAILVRILTEAPRPVTDTRTSVPRHVAAAIGKALEKLPADRFESVADFAAALADSAFTYSTLAAGGAITSARQTEAAATRRGVRPLLHTTVTVALAGAMAWLAFGPDGEEEPAVVAVGSFVLGELAGGPRVAGAVAPDGTIAYVEGRELLIRPPSALEAFPVPGAGEVFSPFVAFSPDGEWLAYFSHTPVEGIELRKIPVAGGSWATLWTAERGWRIGVTGVDIAE